MAEKTTSVVDRFDWRPSVFAAVGALVLFALIMIFGDDFLEKFYILLVAPSIVFGLLIVAIVRRRSRPLAILSMLIVYCVVSAGLFIHSKKIHWTTRWFLWSKKYKAEVAAQPAAIQGLRHIEWDGWGFPGAGDTVVYLVFDPNDSLLSTDSPRRFAGIPCEVPRVRRLERQYYLVVFYTDTDWNHCN